MNRFLAIMSLVLGFFAFAVGSYKTVLCQKELNLIKKEENRLYNEYLLIQQKDISELGDKIVIPKEIQDMQIKGSLQQAPDPNIKKKLMDRIAHSSEVLVHERFSSERDIKRSAGMAVGGFLMILAGSLLIWLEKKIKN